MKISAEGFGCWCGRLGGMVFVGGGVRDYGRVMILTKAVLG